MIRRTPHSRLRPNREAPRRSGAIIALFAVVLTVLIGFLGLVIDGGFLLAGHRQAQSMADTAALAAAMDRLRGKPEATATTTATTFVQTHNGQADATVEINFRPTQGPYQGRDGYVEAIVTLPVHTFFMHVLGANPEQTVQARAVANWTELRVSGEGASVLDPRCESAPGIAVSSNNSGLVVDGGVFDNNGGGGVDENGNPVSTSCGTGVPAASGGSSGANAIGIRTTDFSVVGGVDNPDLFKNIKTGTSSPNILHTGALPLPDLLASLATPSVANGVTNEKWGAISVSNNSLNQTGTSTADANQAYPNGFLDQDAGGMLVHMKPGIYDAISITGGRIKLDPGIYVIAAKGNSALKITGGTVTGNGIMFYNTGGNYVAQSGAPDNADVFDAAGVLPPPPANQSGTSFGDVNISTSVTFRPIDTTNPAYDYTGMNGISVFNGLLFYQRRANDNAFTITGNAADGVLAGTLYAKWSRFHISGSGSFAAQFVVGSIEISGNGALTLNYAGPNIGKAPTVYLVE
jgi:Flp pilus assembly protein TadG